MQRLQYRQWYPTAWQRFQLEENKPKSLPWHLKLAQDESLPLRERCENALQVFEQRKNAAFGRAFLAVMYCVQTIPVVVALAFSNPWALTSISCLLVIGFYPWIRAAVLGTCAARRIALQIKRSLNDDSEQPYLPSQSTLHGYYMIMPHYPWFREVVQECGESTAIKGCSCLGRIHDRRWIDLMARDIVPKPSAVDLQQCIAADLNCAAQQRAEAALAVFSERFRYYAKGVFITALLAWSMCIGVYLVVRGLEFDNSFVSSLVIACLAPCLAVLFLVPILISTEAWVAYHIKSRIDKSLRNNARSELPESFSERNYYIPSDTLLRQGFKHVITYPYYEEAALTAEWEPKDIKLHGNE